MRKIIENQLKFGQVDISKIKIDIICRDEIPQPVTGLQALYADKESCNKVFKILKESPPRM